MYTFTQVMRYWEPTGRVTHNTCKEQERTVSIESVVRVKLHVFSKFAQCEGKS